MQQLRAYRRSAQTAWTRIDMLLAIYDATVTRLEVGIDALHREEQAAFVSHQMQSYRLLLLLLDGIDSDGQGEVAVHVRELCLFCVEQVSTANVENWQHALQIINTLRDGFRGIRDEAIELESSGVVPPLDMSASGTVLHI